MESFTALPHQSYLVDVTLAFLIIGDGYSQFIPSSIGTIKCCIVVVNYFSKWIEGEEITKIRMNNILKFIKRNILARYRIPQAIITANGGETHKQELQEVFRRLKGQATLHISRTPS